MIHKPDILTILAREGITLKRNFASCVFHEEKTASLRVYPANNSYFCYGCNSGGDSIDFIMRFRNLSYKDALHYLNLKPQPPTKRDIEKRKLIAKYNDWQKTYHGELCTLYRTIQNHKQLAASIDDINSAAYHAEPVIEYRLDIFMRDNKDEKLSLYREVMGG